MKKILITGANSYIGTNFENYVKNNSDWFVDTLDMKNEKWKSYDFSKYDVVFHVAGIAHSDNGKISEEKNKLYYNINTKLTIETATIAKKSGVKQFIFMSSAIVYGKSSKIGKSKMITRDTLTSPENAYGDSKVQAEKGILPLNDDKFKVVVLRPPMIYGKGCKGNYPLLSKIAKKLIIFPKISNQRSMLYIENLLEFIRLVIKNEENGIFWPQNNEYTNTSNLVKLIAIINGKKMKLTRAFNWLLFLCRPFFGFIDKAFGSLSYDKNLSNYKECYCIYSFEESISLVEQKQ